MNFEGWSNLIHDSGNFFQVFFPASSHEKQDQSFPPYVWSWNWKVQVCRQQTEHGNWPLEILLQNWAVWKHENPMNLVPADRIRTHLNVWWFVNLLSRIPDPWFVSGCLGFFSSTFCCLFWFLTCPSRQYVRSSSGHFSLDLYMLCKLLGFGKWLQTRHLMLLSMR